MTITPERWTPGKFKPFRYSDLGRPAFHITFYPEDSVWELRDTAGELAWTSDWLDMFEALNMEACEGHGAVRNALGLGKIGRFAPTPKAQQKTTATSLPLTLEDLGL